MRKKNTSVMHRVLGGYEFYPITYKDKQYVIRITTTYLFGKFHVNIYNYSKKKFFLKGHKGPKILYMNTISLEYGTLNMQRHGYNNKKNTHGYIFTFCSDAFEKNFPSILENLLKEMNRQLAKKREKEEILRKNAEWDGVIR